ncbi:MAG: Mut7-C RNAse domain-containing protein, partial [Elusimicrobiota bacterium]
DTLYFKGKSRNEILYKSLQEQRIILTRDHTLSSKRAWKLYLVQSENIEKQIEEIKQTLGLELDESKLFTRCSLCNVEIKKIEREKVKGKVPPYIYEIHSDFSVCPKCTRIYWPGTHLDLILKTVK